MNREIETMSRERRDDVRKRGERKEEKPMTKALKKRRKNNEKNCHFLTFLMNSH